MSGISETIRLMVARGATRDQVAAAFGRGPAAGMAYHRAVLSAERKRNEPAAEPIEAAREDSRARDWQHEQAVAGVFHLVDLKRAGHSPRRTELNIATDLQKATTFFRPLAPRSYTGSHF